MLCASRMIEVWINNRVSQLQNSDLPFHSLHDFIRRETGLIPSDYYLTQNGKRLAEFTASPTASNARSDVPIRLHQRLPGGKGGFGSMLRAIGAQIEKTTNREACRDLSGRRLRDINEEKRLKAYLDKQKEAPADEAAKLQRKIDKLLAKPKHEFHDEDYNRTRSDLTQNIDEAVQEGFRKAVQAEKAAVEAGVKRKAEAGQKGKIAKKKAKGALWLGTDDLGSYSSSDSESDSDSTGSDSAGGSSSGTSGSVSAPQAVTSSEERSSEQETKPDAVAERV
ncbi:splicing regulator SDE2 [Topomyia yanbarensis]|uniref:splicing regulator SDE2 n=1 Tax=Topomyia yanbarensis TaxID=2498891 RepID=UPI00273AFE10|nr:splicing regulator SDE2 [Topomyia yanbarensis]XP_058826243.1 splicing regulator SDE2 [Topomyia yanbarensis]